MMALWTGSSIRNTFVGMIYPDPDNPENSESYKLQTLILNSSVLFTLPATIHKYPSIYLGSASPTLLIDALPLGFDNILDC